MGRFKAPTLRNIAVTAPYMHDGSIATLSEVLDHYAAGGRTIADGRTRRRSAARTRSRAVHQRLRAHRRARRADVIAFLESLTDEALLTDPRFRAPG